ncbi:nuclear transport factor 2 family protein [Nonomuraea jiangxiensis]|uniref:SnoaL-like domain-containing protein n=1 Tax=Nonomuraea jiangxiensis TaxID=633440 RepID=A0A1G8JW53_9ACTN|nr:nuclear transport factor 2 family protein [Nonomuraea jiangxiensis]SDI35482.1 SnoaL-like domain-containing protein [Nonomuraea jiangxiensis]
MTVHIQDSPTLAYRQAGEAHDLDALMATLSDDVAFHSPLSGTATFEGKEQIRELFAVVLSALSGMRYQTDVGDDRTRALTATARLDRMEIHESALVRLDDDGLIKDITMWVRPLPALTAMMAALGPGLARATGRRGLPLLVGAAVRPLAAMTRLGDRTLVPLLTRRRPR